MVIRNVFGHIRDHVSLIPIHLAKIPQSYSLLEENLCNYPDLDITQTSMVDKSYLLVKNGTGGHK